MKKKYLDLLRLERRTNHKLREIYGRQTKRLMGLPAMRKLKKDLDLMDKL